MTIFFSTNIPEMRAIMTFNRVSKDIANIQERITTGLRINSGKDDPGGLIIREGLRVDIKNIQASQNAMMQAENLTNVASRGMSQLLEILRGDQNDPSNNGLVGVLQSDMNTTNLPTVKEQIQDAINLYDSAVNATQYNGEQLLSSGFTKSYRLGTDAANTAINLSVDVPALLSNASNINLNGLLAMDGTSASTSTALDIVNGAIKTITTELGKLGYMQQIIAQNSNVLSSRLTSVTEAEGLISNVDMATESSRLARSELLAQNAMNSILYNRQYAAFSVSSLFG